MAGLNINTATAFDPWVKYNAKAGRWYVKGPTGNEVEVQNPVFVADFAAIKTGWLYFNAGSAPERVWDESLTLPAPKPNKTYTDDKGQVRDCFKRGFSVRVFSQALFGGICELSANSMHLCQAINALYLQYEAGKAANPGMVPVIRFTGSTPTKDKAGTNYAPNFVIDKWVARPAAFDAAPVAQQQTGAPAPVQQQQAAAAPPPAAAPVQPTVNGGAVNEF